MNNESTPCSHPLKWVRFSAWLLYLALCVALFRVYSHGQFDHTIYLPAQIIKSKLQEHKSERYR